VGEVHLNTLRIFAEVLLYAEIISSRHTPWLCHEVVYSPRIVFKEKIMSITNIAVGGSDDTTE